MTIVGDRVQTVVEGETAVYLVDLTWPTPDGAPPVEQVALSTPFTPGDVSEDGCVLGGAWVDEWRQWRLEVTPTIPGRHCLASFVIGMETSISSQRVGSATTETRSVASDVASVEMPLDTVRMVVGEVRPWVAAAWSPERLAGSLLNTPQSFPSVAERTWSTEDTTVATVDADGRITAHAAGTTTLTVDVGGHVTSSVLVVTDDPMGPPTSAVVDLGTVTPVDLDDSRWLGDAEGAPVHLAKYGEVLYALEWTGSGYGMTPVDTPASPLLHATAFLHGGRTWVVGFETYGHSHVRAGYQQVLLDRPTGSSETWRRRELPSGYDEAGEPVPMQDFTKRGVVDPWGRPLNKLIGFDAYFAVEDGQLYLATSQHTGHGGVTIPAGEGHCPSTVRLSTIGDDTLTNVLVDQRWTLRAPPPAEAPDCDPIGVDRDHFPEVALLPAGASGQLPRVEARGTFENVGFTYDGTQWQSHDPVPMPVWTALDLDDGVVVEVMDVFHRGQRCLGMPHQPFERGFLHDPSRSAIRVGAFDNHNDVRVTGSTALHVLERTVTDNEDGTPRVHFLAYSDSVPCLPRADAPLADGRHIEVDFLARFGLPAWNQGTVVQFPVHTAVPEHQMFWVADDGVRGSAGGLELGDGTVIPGEAVLGDANPDGDYWYTTTEGLFRLDTDAAAPTSVPSPVPVEDLARIVALPAGAVLITTGFQTSTWTWIDDQGAVEQTSTGDTHPRPVSQSLTGLADGRLAYAGAFGLVELSTDGTTWTPLQLPGDREIPGLASVESRGGVLYVTANEYRPHHGVQVAVRSSTDGGLTWSEPTWIYPDGPMNAGLCTASLSPDGTEVAAVLNVPDIHLDTSEVVTDGDFRYLVDDNLAVFSSCAMLKTTALP